jgi:tape measure domain-containing protein
MANEKLTIDIEFQSNLNNALKTINKSLEKVDKALGAIQKKKINGPAKGLAQGVKNTEKEVKKLNSRLSTTVNILKGAVVAFAFRQTIDGFRGVQTALKGLIKTAILSASKTEDINTQFRAFTKTGKEARAIVADLRQFTEATPFRLDQVAAAGRTLLAFGESQQNLTNRLTVLGNAAAATGSDLGEVATIFGQIQAAGKLTGERFLQLAERGINIGPALAESLGVSQKELEELRKQGKITADDVSAAFEKLAGAGGQFEGSIKRLSETVSGRFSTLQDSVQSVFIGIGQSFEPVTKSILESLLSISEDVKKFVSENQTEIAGVFKEAVLTITEQLSSLLETFKTSFSFIFELFDLLSNIALGTANSVVAGFKVIQAAFFKLIEVVASAQSKAAGFLGLDNLASDLNNYATAAKSSFDDVFKDLDERTKKASDNFEDAFTFDASEKKFVDKIEKVTEAARAGVEKIRKEVEKIDVSQKKTSTNDLTPKVNLDSVVQKVESASDKIFNFIKKGIASTFTDLPEKIEKINNDYLRAAKTLKDKEFENEKQRLEAEEKLKKEFAQRRADAEQKAFTEVAGNAFETIKQTLLKIGPSIVSGINTQSSINKREKQIEQDRLDAIEKLNSTEFKSAKERIAAEKELEDKFAKERASIRAAEQENAEKAAFDSIKTVSTTLVDVFFPGFGKLAGFFFDLLRDPEATVEFIRNFVDALPVVIEALIIAMPDIAIALAEAIAFTVPSAIIRGLARGVAGLLKRFDLELLQPIKEG